MVDILNGFSISFPLFFYQYESFLGILGLGLFRYKINGLSTEFDFLIIYNLSVEMISIMDLY